MTEIPPGAPGGGQKQPVVYAWYVALVLGLANLLSFMDRSFITLVLDPVRTTFRLTDTQAGLLVGPAFMILYTLAALPLGSFADRHNRKRLIAAGVFAWSLCTGGCGLATSYAGLLATRMGIGLGEATLSPAAVSVLSDLHPPHRLGRAIGLFTAIGTLGGSLAMILGGFFLRHTANQAMVAIPLLGARAPWEAAFLLLSLPGILLAAVILLTIREPRRLGRHVTDQKSSWANTLTYIRRHPRGTILVIIGYSVISAGSGNAWIPTFYAREFGWSAARVGPILGLSQLCTGFAGVMVGGWLADVLRRRGHQDANVRVVIGALCIVLPCELALPNTGNPYLSLMFGALAGLCTMICFGCSTPSMPLIAPPQMRAQMVTLYILSGNIVGAGLGPVLIPLVTDHVFGYSAALRYSLTIVPGLMITGAILLLLLSRRAFGDRVEAVRAEALTG